MPERFVNAISPNCTWGHRPHSVSSWPLTLEFSPVGLVFHEGITPMTNCEIWHCKLPVRGGYSTRQIVICRRLIISCYVVGRLPPQPHANASICTISPMREYFSPYPPLTCMGVGFLRLSLITAYLIFFVSVGCGTLYPPIQPNVSSVQWLARFPVPSPLASILGTH